MEKHKQRRIIRMEICRCMGVDHASSFVFVHKSLVGMGIEVIQDQLNALGLEINDISPILDLLYSDVLTQVIQNRQTQLQPVSAEYAIDEF